MFHGRSANEVALASASIVLALVQRLEKKGTLKREDALALLDDAADRLVATPRDTTVSTQGAADLIRKEFLRRFRGTVAAHVHVRPRRHRQGAHDGRGPPVSQQHCKAADAASACLGSLPENLVIHPTHAAHAAARHGRRAKILLRSFGNHRFRCHQETSDRTRVL